MTIRPGTNWVDEEFWKAWVADDKGSDIAQNLVVMADDPPPPAELAEPPPPSATETQPRQPRPAVLPPRPTKR